MRVTFIFLFILSFSICFGKGTDKEQRPNILLIIPDDCNMKMDTYNNMSNHTPNLDRLAEEGISFTRAYCQYPLCGPSRGSFMTGLYLETNKVLSNRYEAGGYKAFNPTLANHPSMPGFFREQGYYTARVSKVFHMGIPRGIEQAHPGDDDPDSWDFVYNVHGPERQSQGIIDFFSPKETKYGSSKGIGNIVVRDEDQGLMGSLAVFMKIVLFQLTGGTEENPEYQIGSPLFDNVEIQLHPDYFPGEKLAILTKGKSNNAEVVKTTNFNSNSAEGSCIKHLELIKGGELEGSFRLANTKISRVNVLFLRHIKLKI